MSDRRRRSRLRPRPGLTRTACVVLCAVAAHLGSGSAIPNEISSRTRMSLAVSIVDGPVVLDGVTLDEVRLGRVLAFAWLRPEAPLATPVVGPVPVRPVVRQGPARLTGPPWLGSLPPPMA